MRRVVLTTPTVIVWRLNFQTNSAPEEKTTLIFVSSMTVGGIFIVHMMIMVNRFAGGL